MSPTLRFILEESNSPAFNMAADSWLFTTAHKREEIVIRFYGWDPASISLGYMQNPTLDLDLSALRTQKIGFVKRITGGRAIYHDTDLTYSVSFSTAHAMLGSTIRQTYKLIAQCLCNGLALGGLETNFHTKEIDPRAVRSNTKLPCFLAPNRDEVMVDNKKLIGSAQKRGSPGVLQHGSIPLSMAFAQLPDFLSISNEERTAQKKLLISSCTCIHASAPSLTKDKLVSLLCTGFAETLALPAEYVGWTQQEKDAINACG